MIRICLKNRIEIDNRHSERLYIIQFFYDTVNIPAEKIVVEHFALRVHAVFGHLVPIFMKPFALFYFDIFPFKKPVGEYLIHYAAAKPIRTDIIFRINNKLIICYVLAVFKIAELTDARFAAADNKIIKIQARFRKTYLNGPVFSAFFHMQVLSLAPVLKKDEEARLITVAKNIDSKKFVSPDPTGNAFARFI